MHGMLWLGLSYALCSAGVLAVSSGGKSVEESAPGAQGLVLGRDEGDRRLRRPRPEGAGAQAAARMIIKVDGRNGGSSNFFMGFEEILPGAAIPIHRHVGYDEILFIHRGSGVATLGTRQAPVTDGSTVYIPHNTRVGLTNTGKEPLQLVFIFPNPEAVGAYYDELTVKEGQPARPFTADEFAAFRARHQGHIAFD